MKDRLPETTFDKTLDHCLSLMASAFGAPDTSPLPDKDKIRSLKHMKKDLQEIGPAPVPERGEAVGALVDILAAAYVTPTENPTLTRVARGLIRECLDLLTGDKVLGTVTPEAKETILSDAIGGLSGAYVKAVMQPVPPYEWGKPKGEAPVVIEILSDIEKVMDRKSDWASESSREKAAQSALRLIDAARRDACWFDKPLAPGGTGFTITKTGSEALRIADKLLSRSEGTLEKAEDFRQEAERLLRTLTGEERTLKQRLADGVPVPTHMGDLIAQALKVLSKHAPSPR